MDLTLSAEQRLLVQSARAFLTRVCPISRVRALSTDVHGFDAAVWKEMAALGWLDARHRTFLEAILLLEEMGRVLLPSPFLVSAVLATGLLCRLADDAQQQRWLAPMAAGDLLATLALAEPGWRDEWDEPALTAHVAGGQLQLAGVKTLVPFAPHVQLMLVSARASGGESSLIAVESGTPGLEYRRLATLGGDPAYEVHLSGLRVPLANVVGARGAAAAANARMLSYAAVGALAYAVGAADRVLEMTVEYARTRVQFGRPIGSFQAVAHRCADMRCDLDALRYLVYQAAWCLDAGRPADLEVSAAKAYGNEALRRVFVHAHQVHGAIGFSTDHDLQLFTRRAKATELTWGSTALHLERVAHAMGL